MPINELRSIATFVRTAELGSLRKAAAAQGMTPQAASQALAQLERHLGVRLFHRTTRSMSLTEEGQRFMETAQPALLGLQRALQTAKIAKDEMAGPLRIRIGMTCQVLRSTLCRWCLARGASQRRYPPSMRSRAAARMRASRRRSGAFFQSSARNVLTFSLIRILAIKRRGSPDSTPSHTRSISAAR